MTRWTPNQVVAYNLWRARSIHGWSQEQAAERLEPYLGERWSRAVFSAAERSVAGKRVRQFSADDLVAFAAGFDLPIDFFFWPPPESLSPSDALRGVSVDAPETIAAPNASKGRTPQQLERDARHPADDERVIAALEQARERERARFEALTANWPERKRDKR